MFHGKYSLEDFYEMKFGQLVEIARPVFAENNISEKPEYLPNLPKYLASILGFSEILKDPKLLEMYEKIGLTDKVCEQVEAFVYYDYTKRIILLTRNSMVITKCKKSPEKIKKIPLNQVGRLYCRHRICRNPICVFRHERLPKSLVPINVGL